MMKKIFLFLLSFFVVAVFFSCNNENKDLPELDVNSNYLTFNTTVGLSVPRSFSLSAERGTGTQGNHMSVSIDLSSASWDNNRNKPKMYIVVGSRGNVVEVPSRDYQYIPSRNPSQTPRIHVATGLRYERESDVVRVYLLDRDITVNKARKILTFPNQNTSISPLNKRGVKPSYKVLFYGQTTIGNLKNRNRSTFRLSPLGTFLLFSMNNTTSNAVSVDRSIAVNLKTDCFVFSGTVNMLTGLNSSTDTSLQTLSFNINTQGESISAGNRGNIYGLYVQYKNVNT